MDQNRLQRRRHLVTMVGAALLLLVLSGWGIYVLLQNQESDSALQKEVDNIRLLAAQGEKEEGKGYFALAVALDTSLVSVPAGSFIQGSESGAPDERPQRRVYLGLELASAWPLRIDDGWQFRLVMGKGNEVPSPQPVGSYPEGASFYGDFSGIVFAAKDLRGFFPFASFRASTYMFRRTKS